MPSPFMIVLAVVVLIVLLVLGMIGWNERANRRRRSQLVDAMQRSRFGRTK